MSKWQQHYYTWSTNSLSQNKVGLGIVAASTKDRNELRIAENFGAKSEVLREEKSITVERGSYCAELPGFVRTGATPCEQGADQRNNKFVHVYSLSTEALPYPEDYLGKIEYKTQWNGEAILSSVSSKESKKGRDSALAILKQYGLEQRLEELFYAVYHCLLAGEKPLSIVDGKRAEEEFGDFSRKMMILIHYMIPFSLRKEADYVSYVAEDSQEAHFLFRKEGGKYIFDVKRPWRGGNYTLLEQSFYQKLTKAFLSGDDEFDSLMKEMDRFLFGLSDKRNQLEKCIFAFMASQAGKEKKKEDFFYSMERLMYWARKDKSLIPAIQEATKDLDFHGMNEEELLAYTKLLLTGAGGETKQMVYEELNRMLRSYYERKDRRFSQLMEYIYGNHPSVYEQILIKNQDGFTKDILKESIDSKSKLEKAAKYHKAFLKEESYKKYVVESGYVLYQQAKSETAREEIAKLAKMADEAMFVDLKQKDVEKVIKTAENLDEYLAITEQMAVEQMEVPIQLSIFRHGISHVKVKNQLVKEEEDAFLRLGERLSMTERMEEELIKYYQKQIIIKLDQMSLHLLIKELSGKKEWESSDLYDSVKASLLTKRYFFLMKEEKNLENLDPKEWIRFVLRLSCAMENIDKKKAKELVQVTKNSILKTDNLSLLAKANQVLKNHGNHGIHCPKSMWDSLPMENAEDFQALYEQVSDISVVKCTQSSKYAMVKNLYGLAEECTSKENAEKAKYAWDAYARLEKKAEESSMEEHGIKKLLHCAMEDIMSQSIWAVILGLYGYLFVTIRELTKSPTEYWYTIGVMIGLILCYVVFSLTKKKKEITPGAIVYVLGVGILIMNGALALDKVMHIVILFLVTMILSVGLKIFYYNYLDEE